MMKGPHAVDYSLIPFYPGTLHSVLYKFRITNREFLARRSMLKFKCLRCALCKNNNARYYSETDIECEGLTQRKSGYHQ